jgi:hypothetical protein
MAREREVTAYRHESFVSGLRAMIAKRDGMIAERDGIIAAGAPAPGQTQVGLDRSSSRSCASFSSSSA